MLLWIGFAVLTAAVVAALIAPLRREHGATLEPAAAGLAVYRSQLAELEAERERGLITDEEMEGARAEIARRLIKRAEGSSAAPPAQQAERGKPRLLRSVVYVLAGAIPALSIGIYLMVGAPNVPARPSAAGLGTPVEQASLGDLMSRIEARLREHPEDGQGWDVVAPVYLRLERYADAAHAYAEAGRILGETSKRLMGFAEASLLAGNGVVGEDVRHAAERILALEPGRAEARIWLALAKEQDGDLAGALASYREIVASAPAGAPWLQPVSDRLALVTRRLEGEPAADPGATAEIGAAGRPGAAGPTSEDVARAGEMSPGERAEFIARMVDGLADRLKRDGKDLAGWLELVRAYKVLGRETDAVAALGEARRNFGGDQKSLDEIDRLAKGLGLGS